MTGPLFDPKLSPLRRARAEAMGGGYFLHERAFEECLDRLGAVRRRFESALLFGVIRPGWADRLRAAGCGEVVAVEPGSTAPLPSAPDLCLSIGALDTVDELPILLAALRALLAPGGLFIGALAGGHSLPALRSALQAADRAVGNAAAAHIHPRIDAASFAGLLTAAGFVDPVVDIDRVSLRYLNFDALVRDLRAMAATNRLLERARRPILRVGRAAARAAFADLAVDGRTTETIDLLHFAGWAAPPHRTE
ncbi:MAG: hypothetical protein ABIO85_07310 [Sphingomicrobium sp.]